MSVFYRFAVVVAFLFAPLKGSAQEVPKPYYVVIGGFSNERNAQDFCTYAQEQNLPAVYAYNEQRKVFYVYVRATQKREIAYETRKNLRTTTVFRDAWVFNGVLSGADPIGPLQAPPADVAQGPHSAKELEVEVEQVAAPDTARLEQKPSASVPEEVIAKAEPPAPPAGKPFVFRLLNKETGNTVKGLVRLQESERANQFRGVNGNEQVYVPQPSNRAGKWFVVCHVLGFRPYKKPVVYDKADEFEGASTGEAGEVIIPLVLDRVKRGDYVEMDAVKFYNNAALFTPGSERQLDELLTMMEENPDYEIRLHGHTNGNDSRDIVSLGESTDFFNPHLSNAKKHASAKELSLLRAELVKMYLLAKGIDADRITTKGEGGKQMIFDPRGTRAAMNDRVEVEIRKH